MRTYERTLLLWLLVSSQGPRVCHSQSTSSRRRKQENTNKKRNGSSSRSNSNSNSNDNTFNFDHAKEKFDNFFEDKQDVVQHYKAGPKHIGEGLWNTALVSGSATLLGIASVIGFPILTVFLSTGAESSATTADGNNETANSRSTGKRGVGDRLVRFITGMVVGGTLASVSWTGGLAYGTWQIITGVYRTPATLVAQFQGRVYYDQSTATWQLYNLTEHAQRLTESGGGRLRKAVQDDSLYQILQVNTDASPKEIKRAYYRLAKEYHPDKAKKTALESDFTEQEVNDRFLELHRAYETLYDPQKRKSYDEWGQGSDDTMPFDSDVFFDVLFGFSPELEAYVGDLAIKSFSSNILYLILAAQSASPNGQDSGQQEEMIEQLFSSFFLRGQDRKDLRQVEIALYLQIFSKDFVDGVMDLEQFSLICQKEAQSVSESTQFPLFLRSIGKTLYWQGRGAFLSWLNLPVTAMAWTRERTIALQNASWLKLVKLLRQIPAQNAKASEWVENERKQQKRNLHTDGQWKSIQFNKAMEFLLPQFMELVWDFNLKSDIPFTLKGACWKLLHTTTFESTKHRGRQAQALQLLGSSFFRQVDAVCQSDNKDESSKKCTNSNFGDQSRLQRAMEMAMMQGNR